MKILYVSNMSSGVGSFSIASVMAAKELGIEFHMAANFSGTDINSLKENEKKYGVKLHQIDFIRTPYDPRNIKAYRQVVELIKREKFDAIHCNTPIGGVVGRLAGKTCNVKKIIYQAHGFHFYNGASVVNWLIYYPIEKWLAKFTDALITINKEDYTRAKNHFKLRNNGKVYYVPGVGIDISEYQNIVIDKESYRKNLGLSNDDIVIISAGELNDNKNNKVIIEAMGRINDPNLHYLVCGQGELEKKLKAMTRYYTISNNVHFLGYRTDIKELLMISDIFVMPSYREGLSRSLMEAMACGIPCVVSKIRGNVDLIMNQKGGILCMPDDVKRFSNAISTLSINQD